jgi:hypothetical protein
LNNTIFWSSGSIFKHVF